MGRLADLVMAASGQPLSTVAAYLGVDPNLLTRVDQGAQPMPGSLARQLALHVGVQVWQVRDACSLNTDLDDRQLFTALPPILGEPLSPTRITATAAVTLAGSPPPPPTSDRQLIVFFNSPPAIDGRSSIEEYLVTAEGSLSMTASAPDNGDYSGANAGLLVPPDAPTGLIMLDKPDSHVALLDPDTFAQLGVYDDPSTLLISSTLLAWDPDNAFPWFGSSDDEVLYRLDVTDMGTPLASVPTGAGAPHALLWFEGFLYALCQKSGDLPATEDWRIVKVRTTPASEAVVQTSNAWTTSGGSGDQTSATSLTANPNTPTSLFSGGDNGFFLEWPLTGAITPVSTAVDSLPDHIRFLTYDAVSGGFWGTTDTTIFRMSLSGFVGFTDVTNHQSPEACTLQIIDSLGVVVMPAVTGLNNVLRVYKNLVGTPTLLTETAVGAGPDNPTGQNNPPTSFALPPTV